MKKVMTIIILITIGVQYGKSQNDTIFQEEGQVIQSDEKYDRVYKLFIEDRDREIKHLWKVDLVNLSLLIPNIGIEHKIGKNFSSDTYLKGGFLNASTYYFNIDHFYQINLGIGVRQMFKYYYNLKRRERLAKRTNGFSGNYLAVSFNASYTKYNIYTSNYYSDITLYYTTNYGVGIFYGIQRRIGNIGYIEGFAGMSVNRNIISINDKFEHQSLDNFSLGIKAGFAIDSFKNLKRMLK